MERTRRFFLTLRAEGDDEEPLEIIRDLQMELDSPHPPDKLRLRLNIALDAEDEPTS